LRYASKALLTGRTKEALLDGRPKVNMMSFMPAAAVGLSPSSASSRSIVVQDMIVISSGTCFKRCSMSFETRSCICLVAASRSQPLCSLPASALPAASLTRAAAARDLV